MTSEDGLCTVVSARVSVWRLVKAGEDSLDAAGRWIWCYNDVDAKLRGDEQAVIEAVR